MNTCSLLGNLCSDPEIKTSLGGLSYCRFTVAVTRPKKNGTDFISCVAFSSLAEFVSKYFSKGQRIALTGRIQVDSYVNKEGVHKKDIAIIANNIFFCDSKKNANATTYNQTETEAEQDPLDSLDDESLGECDMEVPF